MCAKIGRCGRNLTGKAPKSAKSSDLQLKTAVSFDIARLSS
jgi:hypothetical protein